MVDDNEKPARKKPDPNKEKAPTKKQQEAATRAAADAVEESYRRDERPAVSDAEPPAEPKKRGRPPKEKKGDPVKGTGDNSMRESGGRILSYVQRVERLNEEAAAIKEDTKEVFVEAKSEGYDVSIIRDLIKERKKDPSMIEEHETLMDLYRRAMESAEAAGEGE